MDTKSIQKSERKVVYEEEENEKKRRGYNRYDDEIRYAYLARIEIAKLEEENRTLRRQLAVNAQESNRHVHLLMRVHKESACKMLHRTVINWKRVRQSRAFSALRSFSALSKIRETQLKRTLRRLVASAVFRSFLTWRDRVKDLSRDEVDQRRLLTLRRRSMRSVCNIFARKMEMRVWRTWLNAVDGRREIAFQLSRVVHILTNRKLFEALCRMRAFARSRRTMRQILLRMTMRRRHAAFSAMRQNALEGKRRRDLLRRILLRLERRRRFRAMRTWRGVVRGRAQASLEEALRIERERSKRFALKRVIRRMTMTLIAVSFDSWRRRIDRRRTLTNALEGFLCDRRRRRTRAAFDTLRRRAAVSSRRRVLLGRCVRKLEHRYLSAAFRAWGTNSRVLSTVTVADDPDSVARELKRSIELQHAVLGEFRDLLRNALSEAATRQNCPRGLERMLKSVLALDKNTSAMATFLARSSLKTNAR